MKAPVMMTVRVPWRMRAALELALFCFRVGAWFAKRSHVGITVERPHT